MTRGKRLRMHLHLIAKSNISTTYEHQKAAITAFKHRKYSTAHIVEV